MVGDNNDRKSGGPGGDSDCEMIVKVVVVEVMMVVVFNGDGDYDNIDDSVCVGGDGYGGGDGICAGGKVDVCGNGQDFADTDGDGYKSDDNVVAMVMG